MSAFTLDGTLLGMQSTTDGENFSSQCPAIHAFASFTVATSAVIGLQSVMPVTVAPSGAFENVQVYAILRDSQNNAVAFFPDPNNSLASNELSAGMHEVGPGSYTLEVGVAGLSAYLFGPQGITHLAPDPSQCVGSIKVDVQAGSP